MKSESQDLTLQAKITTIKNSMKFIIHKSSIIIHKSSFINLLKLLMTSGFDLEDVPAAQEQMSDVRCQTKKAEILNLRSYVLNLRRLIKPARSYLYRAALTVLVLTVQLANFGTSFGTSYGLAVANAQEATPSASPAPTTDQVSGNPTVPTQSILPTTPPGGIGSAQVRVAPKILAIKPIVKAGESQIVTLDASNLEDLEIKVRDAKGIEVQSKIEILTGQGDTAIRVSPLREFQPGKFTIEVTDTVSGDSFTQDFTWGVLAINTNKSIYTPSETAQIAMAVLDDQGAMVCDAKVTLEITSPVSGGVTPSGVKPLILSTEDKTIKVNDGCGKNEVDLAPDYQTSFAATEEVGNYLLKLTAETKNGSYTITDSFEVTESVKFDVERSTATRIYPPNTYPVKLIVKANEDFTGKITEIVPRSFQVSPSDKYVSYDTSEFVANPDRGLTPAGVKPLNPEDIKLAQPFQGDFSVLAGFGGKVSDSTMAKKYASAGVAGNDGVDFALPVGTPVLAADDGKVVRAKQKSDYGTDIVIEHSWGKSYYGHLSKMSVQEGDIVKWGQEIGLSGKTGLSSDSSGYLHFAIKFNRNDRDNGYYGKIDPAPYLGLKSTAQVTTQSAATQAAQVLTWNVSIKKGQTITLGYNFKAPEVSPQFYTLGPLQFIPEPQRGLTPVGVKPLTGSGVVFSESREWQIAADDIINDTGYVWPDGDNSVAWSTYGTTDSTCSGGTHCDMVDEVHDPGTDSPDDDTRGVNTGNTSGGAGNEWFDMSTLTLPTGAEITDITLFMRARCVTCSNGGTADDITMNINIGGSDQTPASKTPTASFSWFSQVFSGSWTQSNLDGMIAKMAQVVQGSGSPNNRDDDMRVTAVYAQIDYNYLDTTFPEITQDAYIFENDDGSSVNGDTVQANANTAITSVKAGERITLRGHIKNTGTGALNSNLGLFYDRNDGIFTKVEEGKTAVTASGSCTDTGWDCTEIISANVVGQYTSIAYDKSGRPWISYYESTPDTCNNNPASECTLGVAMYVGSGGTGCASAAWTCQIIVDSVLSGDESGQYTSIAFDSNGKAWVSYYGLGSTRLDVAQYVGTGGSGCLGAPVNWTCETVDNQGTRTGEYTSIAIDSSGTPWVSYYQNDSTQLWVATRGGGFGSACTDADWTCAVVDDASAVISGQYTSIAINPTTGKPWISYTANGIGDWNLEVAQYVGSGGSGCTDAAWTCEFVDDSATHVGDYTSLAFDPSGTPWVSFYDTTNGNLRVATRGGGFGSDTNCNNGAEADWTCDAVDVTDDVGSYTSLAMDPAGVPWVSYYDATTDQMMVTRYVGGTSGTGCDGGSSAWTCSAVDNSGTDTGQYTSIAFAPDGNAWVSFYDVTNSALRVANIKRGGEILTGTGLAGTNGDALSESHADMTSVTDTTERDDTGTALCVSGTSVNWNNGKWFEAEEASGLSASLPTGSTTTQCTEVAFVIDTSQAQPGQVYRFIIASKDNWRDDKGPWRGPIAVSSGAYPTLTIESGTPSKIYSKDNQPQFADCTDTAWGCLVVDDHASDDLGYFTSLAFDPAGNPWISYYNDNTTFALVVANYVGSGGNCDSYLSHTGSDAWNCTVVDDHASDVLGQYTSLAFDPAGNPWISYYNATTGALVVANYVGSGGNCDSYLSHTGSDAWNCTVVDDHASLTLGEYNSLAFDPSGNAWISYHDGGLDTLKVANYVGSEGSCDTSPQTGSDAWNCTVVYDPPSSNLGGQYTSITVDSNGTPWISSYGMNGGPADLTVAYYVGSGGTGCTGGSSAWTCEVVDDTAGNEGRYTSIEIDSNGNPWVSYYDFTNTALKVATKGGGFGSTCTDTDWTCAAVDDTGTVGLWTDIDIDPQGRPWVSYFNDDATATNKALMVARYVSSGGSGCSDSAWSCTTVDSSGADAIGEYTSIQFDQSGTPWVSYYDGVTELSLKVAKLNLPPYKNDLRYLLDRGDSSSPPAPTCDATADREGYCGSSADDTEFDSITSIAGEYPVFNFALKTSDNTADIDIDWIGKSTVGESTQSIKLEVYHFGSTNAWETVTTESSGTDCTTDCTISGSITASQTEYYEAVGSDYYTYWRVWQGSAAETLYTDVLSVTFTVIPERSIILLPLLLFGPKIWASFKRKTLREDAVKMVKHILNVGVRFKRLKILI